MAATSRFEKADVEREEVLRVLEGGPMTRNEIFDLCENIDDLQWVSLRLNELKKAGLVESVEGHRWQRVKAPGKKGKPAVQDDRPGEKGQWWKTRRAPEKESEPKATNTGPRRSGSNPPPSHAKPAPPPNPPPAPTTISQPAAPAGKADAVIRGIDLPLAAVGLAPIQFKADRITVDGTELKPSSPRDEPESVLSALHDAVDAAQAALDRYCWSVGDPLVLDILMTHRDQARRAREAYETLRPSSGA